MDSLRNFLSFLLFIPVTEDTKYESIGVNQEFLVKNSNSGVVWVVGPIILKLLFLVLTLFWKALSLKVRD